MTEHREKDEGAKKRFVSLSEAAKLNNVTRQAIYVAINSTLHIFRIACLACLLLAVQSSTELVDLFKQEGVFNPYLFK